MRRRIYGKSALSMSYSPLMDYYFCTSANGDGHVAVYALWLLSSFPLTGYYFYTSADR